MKNYCEICDFKKSIVIFCFFRTGLHKAEKENIDYVRDLIRNKYFSGGLIGKNNSAYYLLGQ